MAASPTTAVTNSRSRAADGLLIYDGDCGFCTSSAQWYADRSKRSSSIAPWQSLDLETYSLTEAQVSAAAYWVDGVQTVRGADAIAEALKACPQPWRLAGSLMAVPPLIWLARLIYPIIAKNRHRLPGSTDACRLD